MRNFSILCFLSIASFAFGQTNDFPMPIADTDQAFKAAGMLLNDYVNHVKGGRCNTIKNQAIVATYISGADLVAQKVPLPPGVGPESYFAGPFLKYLPDRTKLHWGNWCTDRDNFIDIRDKMITPLSMALANVGNSLGAYAHPEVDTFFQVHDQQGNPTSCILKLYLSDTGNTITGGYLPTSYLRKESGCDALPNLQIYDTGAWCRFKYSKEGGYGEYTKNVRDIRSDRRCSTWPGDGLYGQTWLVWFDNKPISRAASGNDTEIVGTIIGGKAFKELEEAANGPSAAPSSDEDSADTSTTAPSSPESPAAPAAPSSATTSFISCAAAAAASAALSAI